MLAGVSASSQQSGAFPFGQGDINKRKKIERTLLDQLRSLGKTSTLKTGQTPETSKNFQIELSEIKQIVEKAAKPSQQKVSIA